MHARTIAIAVGCTLLFTGCVTKGTHTQTLTDLEQTRKASAQTAAAFESYKKQATAEIEGAQAGENQPLQRFDGCPDRHEQAAAAA